MDASGLIKELAPPLDAVLTNQLLSEFLDLERRFVLADWEPATLNGGQFAEIVARIIYHIDSGTLNLKKELDQCLKWVEDENSSNVHSFPVRRAALHLCKALRMVYKLRSQRGAIHIDPEYTANELDSMFIIATARWIMSELLRVFWRGSTAVVAKTIREIVRFSVPAVLSIDGRNLVLRTDCTVEEEVLILLQRAGEDGESRNELGKAIPKSAPSTTLALQSLCSPEKREVLKKKDGRYVLTPNGQKRVQTELSGKLIIQ